MAYFEWTNTLAIGHAQIDKQHEQLLRLCGAVIEPLIKSAELKPDSAQLQTLIDFAQEHFAFEEGLMRSAGYPHAARHAKDHASLLEELRTYRDKQQQDENTNPVGLISYLWGWLNLHIDSADRDLVVWLKSNTADGNG